MGQPVTVDEVMDYLGVGEESRQVVEREMDAALRYLRRATGTDWSQRPEAAETVKLRVWLTFYAVRGGAQNTQYLTQHLTDLIKQLQYMTGGDADDGQHQDPPDLSGGNGDQ